MHTHLTLYFARHEIVSCCLAGGPLTHFVMFCWLPSLSAVLRLLACLALCALSPVQFPELFYSSIPHASALAQCFDDNRNLSIHVRCKFQEVRSICDKRGGVEHVYAMRHACIVLLNISCARAFRCHKSNLCCPVAVGRFTSALRRSLLLTRHSVPARADHTACIHSRN